MQLRNVEVVLGTILSNADPKHLGRCKVGIPGKFDREVMSVEDLPWVFPFMMSKNQAYTTMAEGQKVWVLINNEVPDEYWYLPFPEMTKTTKSVIGADTDTDILISRDICDKKCQVYYNADDGIVLTLGNSKVQISAEGPITVTVDETEVRVDGGHVFCGTVNGGTEDEMVRGRILKKMLGEVATGLNMACTAGQPDTHAGLLVPGLRYAMNNINQLLEDLLSTTCNIKQD